MINRDGDTMQLACDGCGQEGNTFDKDEFDPMVAEAKAEGWRIAKPEGRWVHECKDCVEENSALAQAKRKFGVTS